MKTALCLFTAFALSFTGCSNTPPEAIRPLAAAATAATIQYAVPQRQRIQVARNTVIASALYERYSAGNIPTPAQFQLVLVDVLPNNESKPITMAGLVSLYSAYYPRFQGGVPQLQLDYLTNFLLGTRDGASPFVPVP
jgi:hypothetical protein